jgi:ribonucleoside-diphosphate reductase alpha chain
MPANQRSEGHQWITSTMRLLSMAARAGSPIAKALADMREVVWEKGPVRCGTLTREDGVQVPVYHDSEVAAVAFTLQRMLIRRGFLDAWGNQVPVEELDRALAARCTTRPEPQQAAPAVVVPAAAPAPQAGRKCPECGARSLVKVDGCERCTGCHYVGSCG